jgi:shikimate kinase
LQVAFLDSDLVIEQRLGCSIRQYFAEHGEASFRSCEAQVIADLTQSPDGVLATGGGAVLNQDTRKCLKSNSLVVYLRSTPEELVQRLRFDKSRPLLQVADPLEQLRKLFKERQALYEETAHFSVSTGHPSVSSVVRQILQHLDSAADGSNRAAVIAQ